MKPDQTGSDLIQTFAKTGKCFVFRPQKFKNLQASRILQADLQVRPFKKSPIEDFSRRFFSKHNSRKLILKPDECTRTYKYGKKFGKLLRKLFDTTTNIFFLS